MRKKTPHDCPLCMGTGKLILMGLGGLDVIECGECDGGRATPASVDDELFAQPVEVEVTNGQGRRHQKPRAFKEAG